MSVSNEKDANVLRFEDALDRTGFGLYSYFAIAVSGLISVSFIFVVYATTFIVPASACELDTTSAQQGLGVATPVIGGIVGTSIWGYLADTRGRRSMLLLILLSSATTNALASLSVDWVMLMMMQFLTVALGTGKYTLAMTIASESVPMAKRNMAVLLVNSIFLLAQGIMALVAIPIIKLSFSHYIPVLGIYWNSWRTLLVVYSVPSLLSAVGLYFMQESPKFAFAVGDRERALKILRKMYKMNKGKNAEEFGVTGLIEETKEVGVSTKSQFIFLFKMPLLKYLLLLGALFTALNLIVSVLVWLPVIADQFAALLSTGEGFDLTLCDILSLETPEDPDAVPCSLNAMGLLIVFGTCFVHAIVNTFLSQIVGRLGNRHTALALVVVAGVGGILMNLVPNAIGTMLLLVMFTVGIVGMGIYAAMAVSLFPTHLRAMAMSLLMASSYLTSFGFTQFLNYLLIDNCELAFYLFALIFTASSLILLLLPDDRPGKVIEKIIDSS